MADGGVVVARPHRLVPGLEERGGIVQLDRRPQAHGHQRTTSALVGLGQVLPEEGAGRGGVEALVPRRALALTTRRCSSACDMMPATRFEPSRRVGPPESPLHMSAPFSTRRRSHPVPNELKVCSATRRVPVDEKSRPLAPRRSETP